MLSVIVPTYEARALALASAGRLCAYLEAHVEPGWEVILVDDGSSPGQRLSPGELPDGVRLLQLDRNQGKGHAVRRGMLEARGDVRVFTDVDLPYDLAAIPHACELLAAGEVHAVFGDRSMASSEAHVRAPLLRRLAHTSFTKLVSLLVISGIADSQCGFKAFSGALTEVLFPLLTVDGFAFDVEVYYVLLKQDVSFRRIPVRLIHSDVSSVSPIKHSASMAAQILRLPVQHRLGRYASHAFEPFREPPYWRASPPGAEA